MDTKQYSDAGFWAKITSCAWAAGVKTVYAALVLYDTLKRDTTPTWAKTAILGALAYLISPVDAIPDFIPGVGFTDACCWPLWVRWLRTSTTAQGRGPEPSCGTGSVTLITRICRRWRT